MEWEEPESWGRRTGTSVVGEAPWWELTWRGAPLPDMGMNVYMPLRLLKKRSTFSLLFSEDDRKYPIF